MPNIADLLATRNIPELYSQEEVKDPTVHALLLGANGWFWAITEYSPVAPDGTPHLAFGWVCGDFPELGYISVDELDEVNAGYLPGAGPVFLDPGFKPRPLSQVQQVADKVKDCIEKALLNGTHLVIKVAR